MWIRKWKLLGETVLFGLYMQKKDPVSFYAFMIVTKRSAPIPCQFICGADYRLIIVATSLSDVVKNNIRICTKCWG